MKKNRTRATFFSFSAFFLMVAIATAFSSCQYYSYGLDEFLYRSNTVDKRADTLQNLGDMDVGGRKKFSVLITTDVHFGGENMGKNGDRPEDSFKEWLLDYKATTQADGTADELYPAFAICLGDVAEHGLNEEFSDYEKFTDSLNMPEFGNIRTFNVVGNHDLYNAGWGGYKKHCAPYTSFYKFRTEGMTWYFVDSASGSLGNAQLTSLSRDMKYNEKGRKKLVFTHIPAYAGGLFYFVMQNSTERNKFISLLAEQDTLALIDGHTHKEITSDLGFTEWNLPGFLEKRGWAILTVDATDAAPPTVKMKVIYL